MQSTSLDQERVILPWEAVHAPTTKDCYHRRSRQFLVFTNHMNPALWSHHNPTAEMVKVERRETDRAMLAFLQESRKDPAKARQQVMAFIDDLKRRTEDSDRSKRITSGQARNLIKPIRLGLELNEVALPWKKMIRLIPPTVRSKDREYTLQELRMIVSASSLQLRVAELIMASCGCRVGAFDYLCVKDIQPLVIDGRTVCGQARIYSDEGDAEYTTLISREALQTFMDYVATRRAEGEIVTDESAAVVTRTLSGRHRMRGKHIGTYLNQVLWGIGLRTEKKRRHEVQVAHGFRKWFDNITKDHIAEDYVEKLIGHDTGTKAHYDRRLPKPAIEQYLKVMPYLSIAESYRSEAELTSKLEKVAEERDKATEQREKELTEMRLRLLEKDAKVNELASQVFNLESKVAGFVAILNKLLADNGINGVTLEKVGTEKE